MLRSRPGVATADCTDVTDEGRHFPDIRAISEIRGFPAVRRELRPLEELPAEGLAVVRASATADCIARPRAATKGECLVDCVGA